MEKNLHAIKQLEQLIDGLNFNELVSLNRLVVDRIRLMQKAGTLVAMSLFKTGDKVWWISKTGIKLSGEIIRINNKTASVKVIDNSYWNVSPQLLQKEY